MTSNIADNYFENYWFVGANHGPGNDQTERFAREGIWEVRDPSQPLEKVKTIEVGAPIAIKSTYTRKNNLPFDNREHYVSTMKLKATGIVTENPGDGVSLKVDWNSVGQPREWYFFTDRGVVWQVRPETRLRRALIDFAFKGTAQDLDLFRNAPYWRGRFGDDAERFFWTRFYEEFADKLLSYRDRRDELLIAIHDIGARLDAISVLQDKHEKGAPGEPLRDICPFTVMALFNRNLTAQNRQKIAFALAEFLDISTADIPGDFVGIPTVNNQRTWFFSYHYERGPNDIDTLWELFSRAISLADSQDEGNDEQAFINAYNNAESQRYVSWNLTTGLHWARPWFFQSLDERSRDYIEGELKLKISQKSAKSRCTAKDYLVLLESLKDRFEDERSSVHSFPDLTLAALAQSAPSPATDLLADGGEASEPALPPYTLDDALDGLFVSHDKFKTILELLNARKNIILQGPPGVGKTFMCKRLAYTLMGEKDKNRVEMVQFHQSYTYEDFIQGYRPREEGTGFHRANGVFFEFCQRARQADPNTPYVFIIDEINRGNLSKIFGELMMLIEPDKRGREWGINLQYARPGEARFSVPENVHLIGMMNTADRSLALVDYALRRRFAFVDLEPNFDDKFKGFLAKQGVDKGVIEQIVTRLTRLNDEIAADTQELGPGFCVGHSYFCAGGGAQDGQAWYRRVIKYDIAPLLREYWFDRPEQAEEKIRALQGAL